MDFAKRKKHVVAGRDFSAVHVAFGDCQESTLVTSIRDDFRASQYLTVSEGYRTPAVSLSYQRDKLIVEVLGKQVTVDSREDGQLSLPEQEVTVEAYRTVERNPDEVTVVVIRSQAPKYRPNR